MKISQQKLKQILDLLPDPNQRPYFEVALADETAIAFPLNQSAPIDATAKCQYKILVFISNEGPRGYKEWFLQLPLSK